MFELLRFGVFRVRFGVRVRGSGLMLEFKFRVAATDITQAKTTYSR